MKQNKIFQQQRMTKPRYSAFDLSREQKLSCQMGELVPTYLEEVLPGDQFRVKTESLVRFAPMLAPIMHRVDVFMHYFFVPNRIIWDEWEEFISGDQDGVGVQPTMPKATLSNSSIRITSPLKRKLSDYLGVPVTAFDNVQAANQVEVSRLPWLAYNAIYNEYYRDPNLTSEVDPLSSDLYTLKYRAWEKDYFTSALPFVQRGNPVGVPVDIAYSNNSTVHSWNGTWTPGAGVPDPLVAQQGILEDSQGPVRIENLAANSFDFQINELRRASALQRWLEKQAVGGYRYVETIFSHFGVRSSDKRLQRPEYLGGGKQPIIISEVLNTSATQTDPQGNMSGHGVSMGETMSFQTQIEEHGYIMGIMSILPKPAYYQGIDKHWLRDDKFDYYWPELANLGEQEVKNLELYVQNNSTNNNGTFGYQQRYAEYKHGKSSVHGDFRTTALEFWHLGRKFGSAPALNQTFIECKPGDDSINRIFAVTEGDNIWVQLYHDVKARRPMPYFANPQLT